MRKDVHDDNKRKGKYIGIKAPGHIIFSPNIWQMGRISKFGAVKNNFKKVKTK